MGRAIDELERGRNSYAASAWLDAYESLSRADRLEALGADDLELLARSAYMVGNDDDHVAALERACELTSRPAGSRVWLQLGITTASGRK